MRENSVPIPVDTGIRTVFSKLVFEGRKVFFRQNQKPFGPAEKYFKKNDTCLVTDKAALCTNLGSTAVVPDGP